MDYVTSYKILMAGKKGNQTLRVTNLFFPICPLFLFSVWTTINHGNNHHTPKQVKIEVNDRQGS